MSARRPGVGIGVVVAREKKLLLLQRRNSHGRGSWCFPGGHLEFGESLEGCARREVLEETGVRVKNVKPAAVTNDVFKKERKHYVTVVMIAEWSSGKPKIMEPEKCTKIGWFEWGRLPRPLFLPVINLIRRGFVPLP